MSRVHLSLLLIGALVVGFGFAAFNALSDAPPPVEGKTFLMATSAVLVTAKSALRSVQQSEARLVTSKVDVQATITAMDRQWYGDATITVIAPGTVHYSVDLGKVGDSDLAYDAQAQSLKIRLPQVEVQSVETGQIQIARDLGLFRTQSLTGNPLEDQALGAIRAELQKIGTSPEAMARAKPPAIEIIKNTFERLMVAAGHQIRINPIF